MKKHYSRLFLKDGSSLEDVKRAYRKLVKKFHPDNNAESNEYTEEFRLIQEAYEILIEHLKPAGSKSDAGTVRKETRASDTSGNEIVKRTAKFAEAGKEKDDPSLYYAMSGLILLFLICCVFAIIDSESWFFRIALSVSIILCAIAYLFGKSKSGSSSSEMSSGMTET